MYSTRRTEHPTAAPGVREVREGRAAGKRGFGRRWKRCRVMPRESDVLTPPRRVDSAGFSLSLCKIPSPARLAWVYMCD